MAELITLQAGLKKEIIQEGAGDDIRVNDRVTVHCTGEVDGNPPVEFWSTRGTAGQPFTFTVGIGEVIQGWDYGCLSMKVGERAKLYIAAALGYGRTGFAAWKIPPNADLIFHIEVLSVERR